MDYHTPFLTGELAEATGLRLDAGQYDDDGKPQVVSVDEKGRWIGEDGQIIPQDDQHE